MELNDLEDRLESAIRHINTALDIDPWAQNLAVESMRMRIVMLKTGQSDIIRCKDCKEYHKMRTANVWICNYFKRSMGQNDFCSFAERKTDGSD